LHGPPSTCTLRGRKADQVRRFMKGRHELPAAQRGRRSRGLHAPVSRLCRRRPIARRPWRVRRAGLAPADRPGCRRRQCNPASGGQRQQPRSRHREFAARRGLQVHRSRGIRAVIWHGSGPDRTGRRVPLLAPTARTPSVPALGSVLTARHSLRLTSPGLAHRKAAPVKFKRMAGDLAVAD